MTFSASSGKVSYDGDGATTAFPTVFKFVVKAHVKAILRDANDVETLWAEGSDYTLTGAGNDAGGTLTATVAPASGETLVILLDVPSTQEKSLPLGGAFPSTQVEEMGDLTAMGLAKLSEVDRRTLKVPESDKITGADLDLPIDSARAGKFLAFDQNGKPTPAVGTTGGLSPVSAYMDTLLPSADAAAARATLDAQRDLVTAGLITARGDLIVGNASPAPARLAKGAANRLLGADGNDIAYFGGSLAKSANYTVVVGDHRKLILVDATSGPVTITLPAAASAGDDFEFAVMKIDASAEIVTMDGDGAETINGTEARTLTSQYDVETYRGDGNAWHVSSAQLAPPPSLLTVGPTATASGTQHNIAIPANAKVVHVLVDDISLTGANVGQLAIQLGDSEGIEATGYDGNNTSGGIRWVISGTNNTANLRYQGSATFRLADPINNVWLIDSYVLSRVGGTISTTQTAGRKALSGQLTQFLLLATTSNFDAGQVTVQVET